MSILSGPAIRAAIECGDGAGSRDDPLLGALICLTVLGTAPHCDEGFEKVVCARGCAKSVTLICWAEHD